MAYLISWAIISDNWKDDALIVVSTRLASHFDKNSGMDRAAYSSLIDEVKDIVKEFDVIHHHHDSTYCYWRQCMRMVFILLGFTRAIRKRLGTLSVVVFRDASVVFCFPSCQLHKVGNSFSGRHETVTCTSSEVHQRPFQHGEL